MFGKAAGKSFCVSAPQAQAQTGDYAKIERLLAKLNEDECAS
jgi:hypothetical protein